MHPPNFLSAFGDFVGDVVNIATPVAALFGASSGSSQPHAVAPVQAVAPKKSNDGLLIVGVLAALLLVR